MRRTASMFIIPLILVSGSALKAQSPHYGFNLNLSFPTGAFSSTTYPAYLDSFNNQVPPQKETYDVGLGGSFTASFPMDRNLAIRLNLGGTS